MWFKNIREFVEFANGTRIISKDYINKKTVDCIIYTFNISGNKYSIKKYNGKLVLNKDITENEYKFNTWEMLEKFLLENDKSFLNNVIRKMKIEKLLKNI